MITYVSMPDVSLLKYSGAIIWQGCCCLKLMFFFYLLVFGLRSLILIENCALFLVKLPLMNKAAPNDRQEGKLKIAVMLSFALLKPLGTTAWYSVSSNALFVDCLHAKGSVHQYAATLS